MLINKEMEQCKVSCNLKIEFGSPSIQLLNVSRMVQIITRLPLRVQVSPYLHSSITCLLATTTLPTCYSLNSLTNCSHAHYHHTPDLLLPQQFHLSINHYHYTPHLFLPLQFDPSIDRYHHTLTHYSLYSLIHPLIATTTP